MLSVEHWSNPLLLWFDSMHTAVFFVKEISPPTALIQPCASLVHVLETYARACVCAYDNGVDRKYIKVKVGRIREIWWVV